MGFAVESRNFDGALVVLKPQVLGDERGFFMETYRKDQFSEVGLDFEFVQDNHSLSMKGVLRGLHFQWDPPMGKLMRVTRGKAFLVAVDLRTDSPTRGKWYGEVVSAENKKQVWAPASFARGFYTLEDYTEVQYKTTGIYNKNAESSVLWNDPAIGIRWPLECEPILSDKDRKAQTLKEWFGRSEANYFKQ
jgi:dTDP-4-dehydrorhamnose 3,5-epimerase